MDPTSIPPPPPPLPTTITTAVPFTLEPNNHVPPAANVIPIPNSNPAAAAPPTANHNHPPYDEMIYTAIGALKEKDGSSKRAIGKYIEQVYRDLPPTHSALLTHHLKRLKTTGLLVMVKKSYKLPPPSTAAPLQTPRGRGRPPKLKPQHQPQSFVPQNAEPVWVALGLADEPSTEIMKRGPGRPRKIGVGPAVPVRRGRPPGTGRSRLPKRPGRPPKPKSVSTISNGLKRRPGRPPKIQSIPTVIPFAAPAPDVPAETLPPTGPTASVSIWSPRPRGRPRKIAAAVPGVGVPPPPVIGGVARGRGRRRGSGVVLPVMRQGRPPKLAVVGRPKRPVGRPKGATAATSAQKVANEDLSRKLNYFQSKVKESLGMLKPYFNHESPVTAIAAMQELEILANLDLKASSRDETQQLQQPQPLPLQLPPQQQPLPQQLPQAQIYQQQYPQILPQPQLQQLFQPHTSAPSQQLFQSHTSAPS
ncbi:histone H1-like isoform X2 [Gastrolobium bilobum]|uniref:histone H1-like isoform X2 n=1 Tax=Gastrolobium bilobum TaxID=150636 RepID=UPI002AB05720|nr:histone H1-like isoform X2 [Gastrolobium bilobum]